MRAKKVKMKMSEVRLEYARLAEVIGEKKLFAGEVNLAIAKNNLALEEQIKCFNESMKNLVERFAAKDESGKPIIKDNRYIFETTEDETGYLSAIEELENTEVEVDIQTVKCEAFTSGKHEEATAFDFVAMNFMIED